MTFLFAFMKFYISAYFLCFYYSSAFNIYLSAFTDSDSVVNLLNYASHAAVSV